MEEKETAIAAVRAHLARGDADGARSLAADLARRWPDDPAVLRWHGAACEASGDADEALILAERAVALRPRNVRARLRLARCLWRTGAVAQALATVREVERTAAGRPGALRRAGDCYAELAQDEAAYRCHVRALEERPDDPVIAGAAADSADRLGLRREAEALYDRVLFLAPEDVRSLERRSAQRRQTEDDNHVRQLGYRLDRFDRDDPRRAPVCRALAKELADLGHDEPAFGMWREGARCRLLLPEPGAGTDADTEALRAAVRRFDADWLSAARRDSGGAQRVFLAGLPGSGTGLVTRLLSEVPGLAAVGAPRITHHAVRRLARVGGGPISRLEAASAIDPDSLAREIEAATGELAHGSVVTVEDVSDELPLLGLLHAALPEARIIHVRRDPLDHCLSLFAAHVPRGRRWSCDLAQLGRHFAAYHALLGHWRRHLPEVLLDVDYEALFSEPERVRDRILDFLGMDCAGVPPLAGAQRPGETDDPPGLARRFTGPLAELAERLRADGVPVQ